jgi:hypothetical protein
MRSTVPGQISAAVRAVTAAVLLPVLLVACGGSDDPDEPPPPDPDPVVSGLDVRPSNTSCRAGDAPSGELSLDT